ncbi:MAG: hypothetical protein HY814_13525 [Candidatus Riflebacteria bacterium]|nr:hypothetical protein [Candidatus Riflebacteria bacterium]
MKRCAAYWLLVLAAIAAFGLSVPGCCGSDAPSGEEAGGDEPALPEPSDSPAQPASSEGTGKPTTGPQGGGDPLGDRQKLAECRELWEAKNYAYIVPMAEALLGRPNLDPTVRMEVCFLLAQSYAGAGEKDKAAETMKRFQQLQADYLKSEAAREQGELRKAAQAAAASVYQQRAGGPSAEPRLSEVLMKKLQGSEAGKVLELEAETGGKIFFSTDDQALEAAVFGLRQDGEPLVLQHDTEFDYYFAILEDGPPPADR